uniref:Uncharacterized protein n=1 Tax=Mycena chlorophos TaxID=658473 RepID=A0ABQ0KU17_MYCCL|nr:predicted protein [Mycena chlorophos]
MVMRYRSSGVGHDRVDIPADTASASPDDADADGTPVVELETPEVPEQAPARAADREDVPATNDDAETEAENGEDHGPGNPHSDDEDGGEAERDEPATEFGCCRRGAD